MASSPHTPEALLGRNDSKNPSTTCKGITISGRPCRRALASLNGRRTSSVGVVAVVEGDGAVTDADFYCWQHKDQAEARVQQEQNSGRKARRKRSAELFPLQERSSIDTLVQRLGIGNAPEEEKASRKTKPNGGVRPPRKTDTTDFAHTAHNPRPNTASVEQYDSPPRPQRRHSKVKKQPSFWSSLCCMTNNDDDDYVEIVRHRRRTQQRPPPETNGYPQPPSPKVQHPSRLHTAQGPAPKPYPPNKGARPAPQQRTASNPYTGHLLSLIPQHCSPTTTSALLAELIKPISGADDDGYIYIFWLTPQNKDAPEESTAQSLLVPTENRPSNSRRISDVMTEYSYDESAGNSRGFGGEATRKTIMLKIGRANNVTRRMNEWQRQCGYKLNLVRWYPYVPSSATPSPVPSPTRQPFYPDLTKPPSASRRQSEVVRKVPYVKRVERLIHLEMAEQRVLRDCEACGKEHREWFEVQASQEGVKAVDDCVRRWVGWAENQADP